MRYSRRGSRFRRPSPRRKTFKKRRMTRKSVRPLRIGYRF